VSALHGRHRTMPGLRSKYIRGWSVSVRRPILDDRRRLRRRRAGQQHAEPGVRRPPGAGPRGVRLRRGGARGARRGVPATWRVAAAQQAAARAQVRLCLKKAISAVLGGYAATRTSTSSEGKCQPSAAFISARTCIPSVKHGAVVRSPRELQAYSPSEQSCAVFTQARGCAKAAGQSAGQRGGAVGSGSAEQSGREKQAAAFGA